ncbi:MAG: cbb3-type cytochrome c oxidase subunit I [Chitinophagaceae bacterium]|nr:cbb3-type cytochrome c oxidase subunit I [Chitinophagaceae bacterium]
MEPLQHHNSRVINKYFTLALLLLVLGISFGLVGALQYVVPGFLKEYLSFEKVRPLHVTCLIFWIILSATAAAIGYLQDYTSKKIFSYPLLNLQFYILLIAIVIILITYVLGIFGGKEYWEFKPVISILIVLAWLLFLFNFYKSISLLKQQPVFIWMWLTGIIFFLFTFLESYLWLLPYFNKNIVNDMTIQWKANGSMVGSWNMLIYGSSIYLMKKISGDNKVSHSKLSFALFFLGLTNLLFNWGHHIYTLPTHGYIKHISYIISMTELFILGKIIYDWKRTLQQSKKSFHITAYKFLIAADGWIFLNLILAIAISIPAVNVFTHGTHITVAHVMGATIGINTFLLFAFYYDRFSNAFVSFKKARLFFNLGFRWANYSLFLFWITLIILGIKKSIWQMSEHALPYSVMMQESYFLFVLMFLSGLSLALGLIFILMPLFKYLMNSFKQSIQNDFTH